MSEWKAKRFWRAAHVDAVTGGFEVRLDARPVRTPAKAQMILPTEAMAHAIAGEWDAQEDEIDPLSMPVTRAANAAIDRVAPQREEVAAMLTAYAKTDLLCHRADTPAALAERQSAGWDPLLDWAAERYGARLYATEGLLPLAQPKASLSALAATVSATPPFEMTALYDLVTLSGSLVLGLAVSTRHLDPEAAWSLSRIDEEWQIEQWGRDEEAEAAAGYRKAQFLQADRFWTLATEN